MAQQFTTPYMFKQNKTVIITHNHNGNLRVSPNNQAFGDGSGGIGKFARWKMHLQGNTHCKLQNVHSGKYLRIWARGNSIDVNGGGGPFTLFKIHYMNQNQVKLESDRFNGKYVAIKPNKTLQIGGGGPHCKLTFWREGNVIAQAKPHVHHPKPKPQPIPQPVVRKPQPVVPQPRVANPFTSEYHFKMNKRVIIGHVQAQGKFIRANPNCTGEVIADGGHGAWAQWDVILSGNNLCQLKNVKTGKYLRLYEHKGVFKSGRRVDARGEQGGPFTWFEYSKMENISGNTVKLHSNAYRSDKRSIAVRPSLEVTAGKGGPHCPLTFWKQAQVQQIQQAQQQQVQQQFVAQPGASGEFSKPYLFKMNNTVVLHGPHGKHLRVTPSNTNFVDGSGGQGKFAQWNAFVHQNNLITFQSVHSGKFLRVSADGIVSCQGMKGGRLTYFKYHSVQIGQLNKVKLRSNAHPSFYLGCDQNFNVFSGKGGPHCVMTLLRK